MQILRQLLTLVDSFAWLNHQFVTTVFTVIKSTIFYLKSVCILLINLVTTAVHGYKLICEHCVASLLRCVEFLDKSLGLCSTGLASGIDVVQTGLCSFAERLSTLAVDTHNFILAVLWSPITLLIYAAKGFPLLINVCYATIKQIVTSVFVTSFGVISFIPNSLITSGSGAFVSAKQSFSRHMKSKHPDLDTGDHHHHHKKDHYYSASAAKDSSYLPSSLLTWKSFRKIVWLPTSYRFWIGCLAVMVLITVAVIVVSYYFRWQLLRIFLAMLRRTAISVARWLYQIVTGGPGSCLETILLFTCPWLPIVLAVFRSIYRPISGIIALVLGADWDSNMRPRSRRPLPGRLTNDDNPERRPRGTNDYYPIRRTVRGDGDWSVSDHNGDDFRGNDHLDRGVGPPYPPGVVGWRNDLVLNEDHRLPARAGVQYRQRQTPSAPPMPMPGDADPELFGDDFGGTVRRRNPGPTGDASGVDERLQCVICQDAERSVLASPCHHCCMCRECAESLISRAETAADSAACPLCRQPITRILDIYL